MEGKVSKRPKCSVYQLLTAHCVCQIGHLMRVSEHIPRVSQIVAHETYPSLISHRGVKATRGNTRQVRTDIPSSSVCYPNENNWQAVFRQISLSPSPKTCAQTLLRCPHSNVSASMGGQFLLVQGNKPFLVGLIQS